jgi:hypothetical protein
MSRIIPQSISPIRGLLDVAIGTFERIFNIIVDDTNHRMKLKEI